MSGLFGVASSQNCSEDLFYGTDYLSHMGTEFGGLAVIDDSQKPDSRIMRKIHSISQGQFKSKFYDDYKDLKGNYGIGVISDKDEQPVFLNSKHGPMAISSAGLIENHTELITLLHDQGISFSETVEGHSNSTEIVGKMITQGEDLVQGVVRLFKAIQGSATFLILTREGVYAVRDRFGYVPLSIGEKNGSCAVTSETNSLWNLDYTLVKNLEPGEIVRIDSKGIRTVFKGFGDTSQICAFLWIYTGFPASTYMNISAEVVRERCGAALAGRDTVDADLVSGIPDSGTAHAVGYSMESRIPFRRALVKYTPGYGRSYTPPLQELRDRVAKMKLIPIQDIINGNRIIVCDDSIVRGTQLKNFTIDKLWSNGAKEIHVRAACPPLMFPCRFCLSTRSVHELATRKAMRSIEGKDIDTVEEYIDDSSEKYRAMVEHIRKDINVTSLRYQKLDDMVDAIGIPKEKLCLYCWNGTCPSAGELSRTDAEQACIRG